MPHLYWDKGQAQGRVNNVAFHIQEDGIRAVSRQV